MGEDYPEASIERNRYVLDDLEESVILCDVSGLIICKE